MKKIKAFVIITLTGLIISLTYNMVQSHSVFPPVENTGAPGESTCQSCHSSYALNSGTGNISVVFNSSNKYQADTTYTITVTVTDTTEKNYGFELTALLNSSNKAAGTFTLINTSDTYLQTGDSPKRDYVSQHNASANNTWTFKWTAPPSDTGDITFYACGVAGNDNGNSGGDEVYTTELQIEFDTLQTTDIYNPGIDNNALTVCPVPAKNLLNVSLPINQSSPITISLFDITGKQLYKWNFDAQPIGQFNHLLYLNNLSLHNGLYIISVCTSGNVHSQKILIQNN